jgi:hypothetical protein
MRRISGPSRFTHSRLGKGFRLLLVVGFILTASAHVIGVRLEADDAFCASCHVEPETAYYEDSLKPAEADRLAAFHAGAGTRCVDCHSRRWIPGRLWAQLGGLQNLLAYWSGNYTSPNVTTRPVG